MGTAIGGLGGVFGAVAAAAAIGCSTGIGCALLLLFVIFLILAGAIGGFFAGSAIAEEATDEERPETSSGAIQVGDFVSVAGPTIRNNSYGGAVVQLFNEVTALLGRSTAASPFGHEEADSSITDELDACPLQ